MPTLQKASRIERDPTIEPMPSDLKQVVGRSRLFATEVKAKTQAFFDSLFFRSKSAIENRDRLKQAQLVLYRKMKKIASYKEAFRDLTGHEVATKTDILHLKQLPKDKLVFELFKEAHKEKDLSKIEALLNQIAKRNSQNYIAVLIAFISFAKAQKLPNDFVRSLEENLHQFQLKNVELKSVRYIAQKPQLESSNKWQRVAIASGALAMIALAGYKSHSFLKSDTSNVQPQSSDGQPVDGAKPSTSSSLAVIPDEPPQEEVSPGLLAWFREGILGNRQTQQQSIALESQDTSTALVQRYDHPTLSADNSATCPAAHGSSAIARDIGVTLPTVNNSAICEASHSSSRLLRSIQAMVPSFANNSATCSATHDSSAIPRDTKVTLPTVNNSVTCSVDLVDSQSSTAIARRYVHKTLSDEASSQTGSCPARQKGIDFSKIARGAIDSIESWGQGVGKTLGDWRSSFSAKFLPPSDVRQDFKIPSSTITSTTLGDVPEPCEPFFNISKEEPSTISGEEFTRTVSETAKELGQRFQLALSPVWQSFSTNAIAVGEHAKNLRGRIQTFLQLDGESPTMGQCDAPFHNSSQTGAKLPFFQEQTPASSTLMGERLEALKVTARWLRGFVGSSWPTASSSLVREDFSLIPSSTVTPTTMLTMLYEPCDTYQNNSNISSGSQHLTPTVNRAAQQAQRFFTPSPASASNAITSKPPNVFAAGSRIFQKEVNLTNESLARARRMEKQATSTTSSSLSSWSNRGLQLAQWGWSEFMAKARETTEQDRESTYKILQKVQELL